ncbi:MAG TPA: hypothetical protein VF748_14795 [Candidatus Acidoferrum sp.]
MDDSAAGHTKTSISGDDLAIGIQLTCSLPLGRQLTLTTAFPQDAPKADLDMLLDRLNKSADKIDATYRLHAVHTEIAVFEKELETTRQLIANYEENATTQWENTGRRGSIKLTESQVAALRNYRQQEEGTIGKIKLLRAQKDTLEKIAKAA